MFSKRILLLSLCLPLFSCGNESLKLNGEPASVVSSAIRDSVDERIPGIGNNPSEPLVLCLHNPSIYLLRGDGDEQSVGKFFLSSIGNPSWRYPVEKELSSSGLKFYSQMFAIADNRVNLLYTELDFETNIINERILLNYQPPSTVPDEAIEVIGREPRAHVAFDNWLILSEAGRASVRNQNEPEKEIASWPAEEGPYWNIRSLGNGWVAWDRLREGTNVVSQGLAKLEASNQSLKLRLVMPKPYLAKMHQLAIQPLANGRFVWLEWQNDWSVIAEWDPENNAVARFAIGRPGDAKVLPTMAVLNRNGVEQIVLTNGKEFRFLIKKSDRYQVVERFTPKDSFAGKIKTESHRVMLYAANERLYISAMLDRGHEMGPETVMAVTPERLRMISINECKDPYFIRVKGGVK